MSKYKNSKTKKIIFIVIVFIIIFSIKKKLIIGYTEISNMINFNMVNYKSNIYIKALKFKDKVELISNSDKYLENIKELKINLQKKELDSAKLKILENENEDLRRTLSLKEKIKLDTIAADVILSDIKDDGIIYISKGTKDGIKINQVVIYLGNMIGKVTKVCKDHSEVTLLTNKNSKIGVIVNNNYLGILRGNGNGTFSIKNYNSDIDINKNNMFELKTSGLSDSIIKDIPLGVYYVKDKNQFLQTKELLFAPTYDYANVKIVLVLKEVK